MVFNEYINGSTISSTHAPGLRSTPLQTGDTYVLFLYPRAFTGVCNKELVELQKRLLAGDYGQDINIGDMIIVGSTDSPEVQFKFYNSKQHFKKQFVVPSVTINPNELNEEQKMKFLDKFGYCNRVSILVKDGEIVSTIQEPFNNNARDQKHLIKRIKELL